MFVVDTNVLVYAVNEYAPEYPTCRTLLNAWRRRTEPWHITWSVAYEFLAVTTNRRVPRPLAAEQALSFIEDLLATPSLSVLDHTLAHTTVLGRLINDVSDLRGSVVHDAHIAALMREHGVRTIYTRDRSFRVFPDIEVIDPLTV